MPIRWKLLLLLLVISLVPTGIAVWIGRAGSQHVADDLADRARQAAIDAAGNLLLQTVKDHGKILHREHDLLVHHVRVQAQEAARVLQEPPPNDADPHFLGAPAAEAAATTQTELDRQAFYLPPDVALDDVAADVARLTRLLPTFRQIRAAQPHVLLWQYASLESGVHTVYPGHGPLPEGYDPRARPWYVNARDADEVATSIPLIDAATREVVLTLSAPIRDTAGRLLGVTALDTRVTDIVGVVEVPERWADGADVMLIFPSDTIPGFEQRIGVLARRDLELSDTWQVPLKFWLLESPDTEQLQRIHDDLRSETSGIQTMKYQGRRCLCAYGALPRAQSAVLVIVPYARILAAATQAEQAVRSRLDAQSVLVFALLFSVAAVVVVLSLVASRHITRPIDDLAAAADRIAAGDFETPVDARTRDELGALGRTVNAMLPQLRDRVRLKHSLEVAMEVQQSLLPKSPPRIAGLDVFGRSIYCDETGGDYYDFIELAPLGPHQLGIAVGDVTGHGIAAALLMATARALLRCRAAEPGSLGDVLNHMNRQLASDVPPGRFMTLSYLLIDAEQEVLRWASAGHDPAIVWHPATQEFHELEGGGGIPLGIDGHWQYDELGPVPLSPGQVIFVGTDGIWEARNPAGEMFGKERLRAAIHRAAEGTAERISAVVADAVAQFQGTSVQEDDITWVVVKVAPAGAS